MIGTARARGTATRAIARASVGRWPEPSGGARPALAASLAPPVLLSFSTERGKLHHSPTGARVDRLSQRTHPPSGGRLSLSVAFSRLSPSSASRHHGEARLFGAGAARARRRVLFLAFCGLLLPLSILVRASAFSPRLARPALLFARLFRPFSSCRTVFTHRPSAPVQLLLHLRLSPPAVLPCPPFRSTPPHCPPPLPFLFFSFSLPGWVAAAPLTRSELRVRGLRHSALFPGPPARASLFDIATLERFFSYLRVHAVQPCFPPASLPSFPSPPPPLSSAPPALHHRRARRRGWARLRPRHGSKSRGRSCVRARGGGGGARLRRSPAGLSARQFGRRSPSVERSPGIERAAHLARGDHDGGVFPQGQPPGSRRGPRDAPQRPGGARRGRNRCAPDRFARGSRRGGGV